MVAVAQVVCDLRPVRAGFCVSEKGRSLQAIAQNDPLESDANVSLEEPLQFANAHCELLRESTHRGPLTFLSAIDNPVHEIDVRVGLWQPGNDSLVHQVECRLVVTRDHATVERVVHPRKDLSGRYKAIDQILWCVVKCCDSAGPKHDPDDDPGALHLVIVETAGHTGQARALRHTSEVAICGWHDLCTKAHAGRQLPPKGPGKPRDVLKRPFNVVEHMLIELPCLSRMQDAKRKVRIQGKVCAFMQFLPPAGRYRSRMTTTNYTNTLIEPAEDCKATSATIPAERAGKPTVATMQYEMLADRPYEYDSDDVLFTVWATRKGLEPNADVRSEFFSKGQACFRASPLTKQFGWSVHSDAEGKIALVEPGSSEHSRLLSDASIKKIRAMRNSRK